MVEATIGTPKVKQIDTTVCFILEQFENVLFVPKYENPTITPVDMSTKPCLFLVTWQSNKYMTGLGFYPSNDTEQYKLMKLHYFDVTLSYYGDCIILYSFIGLAISTYTFL